MADVVVPIASAVRITSTSGLAPVTITKQAITTGQTWELNLSAIRGDAIVLVLEKTDSNAITVTLDKVGPRPDGFSGENLPAVTRVTPAAAGAFMIGPFDTARFKHAAAAGADAFKVTGATSGTLTNGTIHAIAMPRGTA